MAMKYSQIINEARARGVTSEKAMFANIAQVDELLDTVRDAHPEIYDAFIRDTHASLFGEHYDEVFADMDIGKIHYTDREGKEHHGAHWTRDEIHNATLSFIFPQGTTECDKYVAFNSFYADTCKVLGEEEILQAAHQFYFADEDAPKCKIWRYMSAMK